MTEEDWKKEIAKAYTGAKVTIQTKTYRDHNDDWAIYVGRVLSHRGMQPGWIEDAETSITIEEEPHDWSKPGWVTRKGDNEWYKTHGLAKLNRIICENEFGVLFGETSDNLTPQTDLTKAPQWVKNYESDT